MSKPLLYLSESSSSKEKVAKLNEQTFMQRLRDLTEAVQSLNELTELMKQQNKRK